jgi:hypothetical protein
VTKGADSIGAFRRLRKNPLKLRIDHMLIVPKSRRGGALWAADHGMRTAVGGPRLSILIPLSREANAGAAAYDHRVSAERPNAAYLSGAVHRGELPILLVIHDEGGDWQFLDGGPVDAEEGVAVHIDHVFQKFPDLRRLADLPEGWAAERDAVAEDWRRYEWPLG